MGQGFEMADQGARGEAGSRLRVAVLISGNGSNLQALIDDCAKPDSAADIVLVVSNKAGVRGLDRAASAGIASVVISHRDYVDRESFEAVIGQTLRDARIDLVCLAGFMRVLTPSFVLAWQDRLINVHPSLLPAFRGLHTHQRALDAGVRLHGCTVHFVRAELDEGPIIVQAAIPILPEDTAESLGARVQEQEHRAYPLAVRLIAAGRVTIAENRVIVAAAGMGGTSQPGEAQSLISPAC